MTWYYPTLNSSFRGTIANYSFWTILVLICCLFYNLVWYRFVRFNCCCSQFELITWCKFMLYVCASFFELVGNTDNMSNTLSDCDDNTHESIYNCYWLMQLTITCFDWKFNKVWIISERNIQNAEIVSYLSESNMWLSKSSIRYVTGELVSIHRKMFH